MGYLDKALEMMQRQGERIVNHDLLDATLREIGKEYRPGLIQWLKSQLDRWNRLLQLEDRVNQTSLSVDEGGLVEALAAYRTFFKEMCNLYASNTGEQGELFIPGDDSSREPGEEG